MERALALFTAAMTRSLMHRSEDLCHWCPWDETRSSQARATYNGGFPMGVRSHMSISRRHALLSGILIASCVSGTGAQERTRATTPDHYKWNLADLLSVRRCLARGRRFSKDLASALRPSKGRWRSRRAAGGRARPHLAQDKLNRARDLRQPALRPGHARQRCQGMQQEMQQGARRSAWAFFEPEILRSTRRALDASVAQEPRLKTYAFYLHDILRRHAHTLSDAEEALLALVVRWPPRSGIDLQHLLNADFP